MNGADEPPFDRLEVLHDRQPRGAALNMAFDEVLLDGLTCPLLRLYYWEHPAVSFGFFTPWKPVFERYPQHDLVRRWTGGGVVEHGRDVTFSLLVPRTHPLSNGRAGESYRIIHGALRAALQSLGCEAARLATEHPANPPDVAANPCFTHPVRDDVLSAGQKIGGGAQRRTRHGLLHQGSILPTENLQLDAMELAQALPLALARRFEPRSLHAAEEAKARTLAETKYATAHWAYWI